MKDELALAIEGIRNIAPELWEKMIMAARIEWFGYFLAGWLWLVLGLYLGRVAPRIARNCGCNEDDATALKIGCYGIFTFLAICTFALCACELDFLLMPEKDLVNELLHGGG
jgi:hypothetical protein